MFVRPTAVTVAGCRDAPPATVRGKKVSATLRCPRVQDAPAREDRRAPPARHDPRARRQDAAASSPSTARAAGVLLRGRGSALNAMRDVDRLQRHPAFEVSGQVVRTEIVLRLEPAGTVEQVNAALRLAAVDRGALVGSSQLVAIPDPGSPQALERLLAGLRRRPGVESAGQAELAEARELPSALRGAARGGHAAELSHLLAMRMPAAWNARRALRSADRPLLLIADKFGNGPLSSQVDAERTTQCDLARTRPWRRARLPRRRHRGVAASRQRHRRRERRRASSRLATRACTSSTRIGVEHADDRRADHPGDQRGPGPWSWSTRASAQHGRRDADARQGGSDWAQLVRGTAGLEDRLLHAASAGNRAASARNNGCWSSAAMRTDLTDAADGTPMTPLGNTLAVENLVDTGAPAFEPACLGVNSNRGGTSPPSARTSSRSCSERTAGNKTGTSMASPQVAGLATYLWSIAPGPHRARSSRSAISRHRAAAAPNDAANCGTDVPSAPRLDAYAAVLSLDRTSGLSPSTAPVRSRSSTATATGRSTRPTFERFVPTVRGNPSRRTWDARARPQRRRLHRRHPRRPARPRSDRRHASGRAAAARRSPGAIEGVAVPSSTRTGDRRRGALLLRVLAALHRHSDRAPIAARPGGHVPAAGAQSAP